jgi:hypothetical protein
MSKPALFVSRLEPYDFGRDRRRTLSWEDLSAIIAMALPARKLPLYLSRCHCDGFEYAQIHDARSCKRGWSPTMEGSRGDLDSMALSFELWRWMVRTRVPKSVRRARLTAIVHILELTERPVLCRECGRLADQAGTTSELEKNGLCFGCLFWTEKLSIKTDPTTARVNGHHYFIGSESSTFFRGFGGDRFVVAFHDGRRVTTTNLWTQGKIPDHFRARLPDNAVFDRTAAAKEAV